MSPVLIVNAPLAPCSFTRIPYRRPARQSQLTSRLVLASCLEPSPRCQSAETRDLAPLIAAQFVCTRLAATLASTRGTDQFRVGMFLAAHRSYVSLWVKRSPKTCKQKAVRPRNGNFPDNPCRAISGDPGPAKRRSESDVVRPPAMSRELRRVLACLDSQILEKQKTEKITNCRRFPSKRDGLLSFLSLLCTSFCEKPERQK